MAKTTKLIPQKKAAASGGGAMSRWILPTILFVSVLGFAAVSLRAVMIYVDKSLTFPNRPTKVVLVNRPAWMSDGLAEQIIIAARPMGLHSAFDHQLLVDTTNLLNSNPWVRKVNAVRRTYGQSPGDTLEIDCEFRAPVALAKWGEGYWLVDADGIKLPDRYSKVQLPKVMFDDAQKLAFRIVQGMAKPPQDAGVKWPGDDLAAGLEVLRLLAGRGYTEEIRAVDVSNFNGRKDARDAHLVLITQYGTQVRWGRAPSAKDAFVEVPAAQKLLALQTVFDRKHRVDAGQAWIDIRFEHITCPAPLASGDGGN